MAEGGAAWCGGEGFRGLWGGFVDALAGSLHARGPPQAPPPPAPPPPPTRLPAAERVVAIGDLHGDLAKTRRALRLAGLIDGRDRWVGGATVAVQVGDQLDRGGDELAILHLLERLQGEARKAGGAVHVLNGNHETMSVDGRFRYASGAGLREFQKWQMVQLLGARLKGGCGCGAGACSPGGLPAQERMEQMRITPEGLPRAAALQPGGPVATRFFSGHPIVLQVGSTVFAHGGVLPAHVDYGLERINRETSQWMQGRGGFYGPWFLQGRNAVVWSRHYSVEEEKCDCATLEKALGMIAGAERMVLGHTVQDEGINGACRNRVFRIDVGLSKGVANGEPEVLEILRDAHVRRLREGGPPEVLVA